MLDEISRFVNWVRRRNPDAHTWRDYRCDLKQFVQIVGDRPPGQITHHDIDHFISRQAALGMQAITINRRLAAIASLYLFLGDDDPALVCPVLPHRHQLRERKHLPRPVAVEDLQAFFDAIDDLRDRTMFTLMLRCGLRISEVAKLQINDLFLNDDNPRLHIQGKGGKERTVYLSPQAERLLRVYLKERPAVACDFLFLSYQLRGLSTTAIHKRLMGYRNKAGIQITAHRLRHAFAHDLLSADAPVTTIQKLLGHRWLETTQIYVEANDRQVQEDFFAACEKLEGWQ